MSTYPPRLEARVSAQERMQTILHARIEELAQDMTDSFKQQATYQVRFEQKVDDRFDRVEAKIAVIEENMATKDDLASLRENLATLERRMDSRIGDVEKLLIQLLARLPEPS